MEHKDQPLDPSQVPEWRSRLEQMKHLARGIATCPVGDCVSCKTAGRLLLERLDDLAALPEGEETPHVTQDCGHGKEYEWRPTVGDSDAVTNLPPFCARCRLDRLSKQAIAISTMLSDAGVGAMPIEEAVRRLVTDIERIKSEQATCHKHTDPLVCLACEAEEDARPEWQKPHRVTPPRLRGEPPRKPEGEETSSMRRDRAGRVVQWLPIASAPKDGTRVLAWRSGWDNPAFVRWVLNPRTGTEFWNDALEWDGFELEDEPPTHWHPLSPPPSDRTIRDPQ